MHLRLFLSPHNDFPHFFFTIEYSNTDQNKIKSICQPILWVIYSILGLFRRILLILNDSLLQNWHHGAARAAQRWADQCLLLQHDTPKGRWMDQYGSCGQNIFVSTHKVSW